MNQSYLSRGPRMLAAFLIGGLLLLHGLLAQQLATGSVEGRVLNPATRDYVANAEVRLLSTGDVVFTEPDGSFRFINVPVGEAKVSVSYTGYETVTTSYNVVAGQSATQEISLLPLGAAKKGGDDGTIMLEAFTVSSEREGNSKAIMAQRKNMDITTSVSSDLFGDVADGNVGEFLKYLPGVDLEYVESEARGPRLGGMDAQYVGVAVDGLRIASADGLRTGDASRATSFEAFSISAIDSVEIYYTTSPEGSADSPAGTVNMRTRRAFDTKGRRITFNTSLNFNTEEFTLRQTVGPDDRWHYKWKPNWQMSYADSWRIWGGKKFGIVASGSRANSYTEQYSYVYDYNNAPQANDPRPMVIRQIDIKDGPKFIFKDSFSLNADMQVNPRLVLSLNTLYTYALGEFHNRNFTWVAANSNANVNNGRGTVGGDGVTTVIANRTTANTVPTVNNGGGSEAKKTWTRLFAPRFEYKLNEWTFDGVISKSKSVNNYMGLREGISREEGQGAPSSWIATRSDQDSHEWTIRQTGGSDWFDYNSWGPQSTDNRAGGTRAADSGRKFSTEIWDASLNARWVTPFKKFPTTFKVGAKWNEEVRHHLNTNDWEMFSYVGPNGNQIYRYNATTGLPEFYVANTFNGFSSWNKVGSQYVSPHPFDTGTTNGITVYNINGEQGMPPRANRNEIANLFNSHPEWFVRTGTLDNYYNGLIASRRDVKQTVDAGYFQADMKLSSKLSIRTGVRVEKTVNAFKEFDPRTKAEILAAGYGFSSSTNRATTFEGLAYQFLSNPRVTRESDYVDLFPSITAKYFLAKNIELQGGYNYSIGRPPIDILTGVYAINETTQIISAPNARLEPEYHKKYQARLAWYFEPSGQFSIALSQIDTSNMRATKDFSAADFGITDEDLQTYMVTSTYNIPGVRTTRSMDLTYRQSLTFLPKAFRGTTVNANYTRAYVQEYRRLGTTPHRISGGLSYAYNRFNGAINFVWRDKTPWSNEYRWQEAGIQFDTSVSWKLSNNLWFYVQGRNITKEPVRWFETPKDQAWGSNGHLRQYQYYGSNWVFGVRGTF